MMKSYKNLIKKAVVGSAVVLAASLAVVAGGKARALACWQYDPSGNFQTSTTPVFNNICGITVPLHSTQGDYPFGDEPNFVRIRPHASSNPSAASNPPLVNNLSSACNDGDEFDVWTYVHNDAMSQFNNNGSGSAVAKNVVLSMAASKLNQTGNSFPFSSTVTASNAASVQDGATLSCNGQPVKLTLVHNSESYSNNLAAATYQALPSGDSAVNGSTALGNPVFGSGIQWGCWDYRTIVVYTVKVEKQQTPPQLVCSLTNYQVDGRTVKLTITPKNLAQGDTVIAYDINWGDGSKDSNKQSDSHTYTGNGPFSIVAKFEVKHASGYTEWVSGGDCNKTISFTPTPTTPQPTPTALVNTGAGDVFGIFSGTTLAGAFLHRKWSAAKAARR